MECHSGAIRETCSHSVLQMILTLRSLWNPPQSGRGLHTTSFLCLLQASSTRRDQRGRRRGRSLRRESFRRKADKSNCDRRSYQARRQSVTLYQAKRVLVQSTTTVLLQLAIHLTTCSTYQERSETRSTGCYVSATNQSLLNSDQSSDQREAEETVLSFSRQPKDFHESRRLLWSLDS